MYVPLSYRILSWFSLRWSHRIGAAIGWLIAHAPNKPRDVAEKNIALCYPDLDEKQRRWLVKKSFSQTGKMLCELGPIWFGRSSASVLPLIVEIVGEKKIKRHLDAGQGVILAAPHVGSWEVLGMYLSEHYQMTSMYKPLKGPFDASIRQSRERLGAKLVPSDNSGVKALLKGIKAGQLVGILPDQDPSREAGVFAPFFGNPANTPLLVVRLAQRTKAPVVFSWAERLPHGNGYRIHFIDAPDGLYDPDPEVAAAALNRGVERCVGPNPEQYWWSYPRFRRQPLGARSLYDPN
ncbi:MAG: KDO2-lipid IV(A) lauroyltransferase [Gammaproteobacteria bacterium]|jgi:KDO2-lipid IV(A) lauroyltransferase